MFGRLMAVALLGFAGPVLAERAPPLPVEQAGVAQVPLPAGDHWLFAADTNFWGPADGKSYLLDAATGAVHGVLSAGYWHMQVHVHGERVYSAQTHYSRTTRGERTDVVVAYDLRTLKPEFEVLIPPRRATFAPMPGGSGLLDGGRFMVVYNFDASQSFTVVDLDKQVVTTEGDAAGCVLVYPSGKRQFGMLCGDGAMLTVGLGRDGQVAFRERSAPFFDPVDDPVAEEGVRIGDRYYFVSFEGNVHPVKVDRRVPQGLDAWSMFSDAERAAGWRMGGSQLAAASQARGELYVLVHQGKAHSHKDAGQNVFVYDADSGERLREISLSAPATSIAVTGGDAPLLVTNGAPFTGLHVYDAVTGKHVRTVPEVGVMPLVLAPLYPQP